MCVFRRVWFVAGLMAGLGGLSSELSAAEPEVTSWPSPVKNWKPLEAGEHPRLFFRKSDLPELRKRAETPEGKAIVARLKVLLGGGEDVPTSYSGATKAYDKDKKDVELPVGTYTISHVAGFGFLYQLTGDKKYAALGKQCFEKALAGVRDRDDRYAWQRPGGALRAGPALAWYAVGYDLCYDGWDEEFRKKIALELQNYNQGEHMGLVDMAHGRRHGPGSNHWGPEIAGPAMALLAIQGDPGVDEKRVGELLKVCEKSFLRQLTEGWGDHGFFAEGDGPGTISSDTAFVPTLQAWRTAAGKDFITPRPNASWMTLKWVMLTVSKSGQPVFPIRGTYEKNVWSRVGMSGSGTFSQGFGAIPEEYRPALLWTYRHCVSPKEMEYDTISPYPGRAILAFVNWPFGIAERNPGELLPRAVEDKARGFYMFRNRWQDDDDIVVTALLKNSQGNYSVPAGEIIVLGLGEKTRFPIGLVGEPTYFRSLPAGGVVSSGKISFGVDFSRASGAEGLLVMVGEGALPKFTHPTAISLNAGKYQYVVMTLQKEKGEAPVAKVIGEKVIIGGQTLSVEKGNLTFSQLGHGVVFPQVPAFRAGDDVKIPEIVYIPRESKSTVASAKWHFRRQGAANFETVELTKSDAGQRAGGPPHSYTAALPASVTGQTVEAYVEFREQQGSVAYYPTPGKDGPLALVPDVTPPVMTADPQVSEAKSYRMALRWPAADDDRGIAAYRVYRGMGEGVQITREQLLAEVPAEQPHYVDGRPPIGQAVWYAVVPIDVVGRVGEHRAVRTEVPKDTAPEMEDLKLVATSGAKAITVNWYGTFEPDVTGIIILRAEGDEKEFKEVANVDRPVAAKKWVDQKVLPKVQYRYQAKLRDAAGNVSPATAAVGVVAGRFLRRINCGGPEVASADGIPWEADLGNVSGTGRFLVKEKVEGVAEDLQEVYQSERWSNTGLRYRFDVEPGKYAIRLLLAETNPAFAEKGKRTFHVLVNGEKRLSDVDLFTEAGKNKGWEIRLEATVSAGKPLEIELLKGNAGPALKGLEIRSAD